MTGKVVRVGFHINRFGELESIKHEEIQAGNGQIKQVRVFIFFVKFSILKTMATSFKTPCRENSHVASEL